MKKIENNFAVTGFVGKDAEIRLRFPSSTFSRKSPMTASSKSTKPVTKKYN